MDINLIQPTMLVFSLLGVTAWQLIGFVFSDSDQWSWKYLRTQVKAGFTAVIPVIVQAMTGAVDNPEDWAKWLAWGFVWAALWSLKDKSAERQRI